MTTNNSATKPSIFSPVIAVFSRYHLTIFTVVFVGGLATAVLMLNAIMAQSSDTSNVKTATGSTTFDQVTIDRINQLKTSNDTSTSFTLPSGRSNPFAE